MGNYYYTDFTWGAGSLSNISFLNTALMDYQVRKKGLDNLGYGDSKIIVGYPGGSEEPPEDCTDNRYDLFKDIHDNYALDIDNKWIYYSNDQGIHRIHLDGTGEELATPKPGFRLKVFDGVLYFIDENMTLYQWEEGKAPVILESSVVANLELEDCKLRYNIGNDTNDICEINLSKFMSEKFQTSRSQHFATYQIPKTKTFQIVITFSEPILSQSLKDYIGLVNRAGKNIPISMVWSGDYKIMTIRSKELINQVEGLSLKVASGIEAVSGLKTVGQYDIAIKFMD